MTTKLVAWNNTQIHYLLGVEFWSPRQISLDQDQGFHKARLLPGGSRGGFISLPFQLLGAAALLGLLAPSSTFKVSNAQLSLPYITVIQTCLPPSSTFKDLSNDTGTIWLIQATLPLLRSAEEQLNSICHSIPQPHNSTSTDSINDDTAFLIMIF